MLISPVGTDKGGVASLAFGRCAGAYPLVFSAVGTDKDGVAGNTMPEKVMQMIVICLTPFILCCDKFYQSSTACHLLEEDFTVSSMRSEIPMIGCHKCSLPMRQVYSAKCVSVC